MWGVLILNNMAKSKKTALPETISYKVTQEDLDNNSDLAKAGVTVGQEIEIPAKTVVKFSLFKACKEAIVPTKK